MKIKNLDLRAKIILLKDDGYTVPQIRKIINHHDHNIRKWIHHRFDEKGINDGIISKKHNHKQQYKFDNNVEKKIVNKDSSNPIDDFGLGVSDGHYVYLQAFICMT